MSKQDTESTDQEQDEFGLVVHKYVSKVLVVVPPTAYAETTLRYARSSLYNVHVGTWSVSTEDQALIKGELQDEFQVDGLIGEADLNDYSGVIFCGGPGALELADNPDVLRLAREAVAQDKLVAAWGHAALILARAGILKKTKVTGDPSLKDAINSSGGRYTGTQIQVDGKIVTAQDDAAGLRFGKALVQIVRI